mmetsp:Transcript_32109/g.67317  ORF Transcript_32109/g.67317 Transcript_32109/m.67317 type:complete len:81 (+) Transcript_32109:345-587(+)
METLKLDCRWQTWVARTADNHLTTLQISTSGDDDSIMLSFPSLAVIATDLSSSEIGDGIHNCPTYALVYTKHKTQQHTTQ